MTTEAAYYDETMIEEGSPAMLPVNESPWLPLYREAASWIPANHDVVDLGCGTGRFMAALAMSRLDYDNAGELQGIDFSIAAIHEAADYLTSGSTSPSFSLHAQDLREWQPSSDRAGNTTYTCLEVLEHLQDDLDLVSRIPPGHQFVLSLPSYESESHLRWFRGASDVATRYAQLLDLKRWSLIALDPRKCIHLFDTVRRTDTW